MDDFKPITTQDEFNAAIADRLKRAKESARAEFAGFDEYKAKAEKYDAETANLTSQISDLQAKLTASEGKIKAFEINNLKTTAAIESGLPAGMASRIAGETEEDIRKDAKSLAEFFKSVAVSYPTRTHAEPEADNEKAALQRMIPQ